jgi:hypothetical protein
MSDEETIWSDDIQFTLFVLLDHEKGEKSLPITDPEWVINAVKRQTYEGDDAVYLAMRHSVTGAKKEYMITIQEVEQPQHPDIEELKRDISIIEGIDTDNEKEIWDKLYSYFRTTIKDTKNNDWWKSQTTVNTVNQIIERLDKWTNLEGNGRRQKPEDLKTWVLEILNKTIETISKEEWHSAG